MKRLLISTVVCLIATLGVASVAAAQGAAAQPGVEGGAAKAAKPDDPNPLLTDPAAVEVAAYQCSQFLSECPLKPETVAALTSHFQQPLRTGDGHNTELATAVLSLLSGTRGTTHIWDPTAPYAAVHLVDLNNSTPSAVHDRWILASRKGGAVELSQKRRILGAHRIGVLFVYLNAEAPKTEKPADQEGAVKLAYNDVSYRAVVKKKRSIAFEHLLGVLRLSGAGQSDGTVTAAFLGYGTLTDVPTPSDVSLVGVRTSSMKIVGQTVEYDNEGKSIWDVSVAVPVNKLSLLEYEETEDDTGTFVPKQINKQSIYGVVNLYPVPVDLKEGTARWVVPRLIAGLGLTGRPGENVLVGLALGIPEIQFFVGRSFTNHRVPIAGTDSSNGANFTQEYEKSWSFGINLPVVSALKKVTGGGGKKAGS